MNEREFQYKWTNQSPCDVVVDDGFSDGGTAYTEEEIENIHIMHYKYLHEFNGCYDINLDGLIFRVLKVIGNGLDEPKFLVEFSDGLIYEAMPEEVLY